MIVFNGTGNDQAAFVDVVISSTNVNDGSTKLLEAVVTDNSNHKLLWCGWTLQFEYNGIGAVVVTPGEAVTMVTGLVPGEYKFFFSVITRMINEVRCRIDIPFEIR